MKTKAQAQKLADKISAVLGKNWKSEVWENLGWHVDWTNGAISLNYNEYRSQFWCFVGEPNSGTGHLDFHDISTHSSDPIKVIKASIHNARKVIKTEWTPIIDSINEIDKEMKEL